MRGNPQLLEGPVGSDVLLMRTLDGWVAKGGAEGLMCAASPDGLGLAIKVTDGSFRAIVPVLVDALERLGVDASAIPLPHVSNSHGEVVGTLRIIPPAAR
jgi:L-asparaginase II